MVTPNTSVTDIKLADIGRANGMSAMTENYVTLYLPVRKVGMECVQW